MSQTVVPPRLDAVNDKLPPVTRGDRGGVLQTAVTQGDERRVTMAVVVVLCVIAFAAGMVKGELDHAKKNRRR